MSQDAKRIFQRMKEKTLLEDKIKKQKAQEKARILREKHKVIDEKLMKFAPSLAIIFLPFIFGTVVMAILVLFIASSLSIGEFYQVFQNDYSFAGLWGIGYITIISLILIFSATYLLKTSFIKDKPKFKSEVQFLS